MAETEFKGKVRRARTPRVVEEAPKLDRWHEGVEVVVKNGIEYRVSTMAKPRESHDHRVFQDHKRLCTGSGGFLETDNDMEEIKFFTPMEEYKKRKLAEESKFRNQEGAPYRNDGTVSGSKSMEIFEERPISPEDLLLENE